MGGRAEYRPNLSIVRVLVRWCRVIGVEMSETDFFKIPFHSIDYRLQNDRTHSAWVPCVAFVGRCETIGKGICRCLSPEHADNELELGIDDLPDGLLKKPGKEQNQLEVAIGDGMEFTIHGDSKNKVKKGKAMLNNINVSRGRVAVG